MKKRSKITILAGVIFIIGGIYVAITGQSWGIPASRAPGFFSIILGGYILWAALRKNFSIIKEEVYLKCMNCGFVLDSDSAKDNKCPKCGTELEELNRFFDRHPEHKD